jgi:hypothetical protein
MARSIMAGWLIGKEGGFVPRDPLSFNPDPGTSFLNLRL